MSALGNVELEMEKEEGEPKFLCCKKSSCIYKCFCKCGCRCCCCFLLLFLMMIPVGFLVFMSVKAGEKLPMASMDGPSQPSITIGMEVSDTTDFTTELQDETSDLETAIKDALDNGLFDGTGANATKVTGSTPARRRLAILESGKVVLDVKVSGDANVLEKVSKKITDAEANATDANPNAFSAAIAESVVSKMAEKYPGFTASVTKMGMKTSNVFLKCLNKKAFPKPGFIDCGGVINGLVTQKEASALINSGLSALGCDAGTDNIPLGYDGKEKAMFFKGICNPEMSPLSFDCHATKNVNKAIKTMNDYIGQATPDCMVKGEFSCELSVGEELTSCKTCNDEDDTCNVV